MVRFLFLSLWLAAHPVHVTLMSIDYLPEQKLFNVFLKLYYDDFLLDSGLIPADQKNLDFSENNQFVREAVENYFNKKIKITVNNLQIQAEMGEVDLSDNELKMKLYFSSPRKVNTITVKNLILTSLYSDQANMIIVKVNDFEEGFRLTTEEPGKTFEIN